MDAIYQFARNFINTKYEDLPSSVVETTKKQVIDLLGVALGGASQSGVEELLEIVLEWGGKEESHIIGTNKRVPAPNAAHVNATMAHALDFDDVHEHAIIHPGVAIIPPYIAVAERKGRISGKQLIEGAALGTDMMSRLAAATTPGQSPIKSGWHLTSIYGYIGAAAVSGKVLNFDEEKMVNAMGIAYHQSAGNGQCVKDAALTKRLGPGFAAKGGVTAALMAEKGITGARNILEGEMGLYAVYFQGRYDPEILTKDIGTFFEGVNVAIKPYPCCRGVHPSIDAALALAKDYGLAVEDIAAIRIAVTDDINFLLCTPLDAKCNPRNPVDAQFSIPWGVATALSNRGVLLEDFTQDAIENKVILDLANKVAVEVDNTLKKDEKVYPARIEIETKEGKSFSRHVVDPLGSIERPMSFDDCARKFKDCARMLPDEQINRAIELIGNLEELEDIGDLVELLTLR
jgi:2-methylcitrate dehydratase PrpD